VVTRGAAQLRLARCMALCAVMGNVGRAQTVLLNEDFCAGRLDEAWAVVPFNALGGGVRVEGSRLSISVASPTQHEDSIGLMTNPARFPLFRRPADQTEYDAYFLGVRLADRKVRVALGLYSFPGTEVVTRPASARSLSDVMSYSFLIGVNAEAPNAHWVSTATIGHAGAAADSTGPHGFHVWEHGKVYDFRIQVTRWDVTWWGRVQPNRKWLLLQDPGPWIGYPGDEPGGRCAFGLFIAAEHDEAAGSSTQADPTITVDRIVATCYEPVLVSTLLDCDFRVAGLDRSVWAVVQPEPDRDRITAGDGAPLRVVSSGAGAEWTGAAGIWTVPGRFPIVERPTLAGHRVYVDFLGVALPARKQRCVLGLYSLDAAAEQTPRFPDGTGPGGGLAYAFWVLPDNDRLLENSNQLRALVINDKYAATDNYHHAWIWPYTEKRDLRLEITADDVTWYFRQHPDTAWRVLRDAAECFYRRPAVPEDRATGYWRPLYDPGIRTGRPYDGREPNGRNRFGVFVHVSAAGQTGPVAWEDGDLRIDAIRVTTVAPRTGTSSCPEQPRPENNP